MNDLQFVRRPPPEDESRLLSDDHHRKQHLTATTTTSSSSSSTLSSLAVGSSVTPPPLVTPHLNLDAMSYHNQPSLLDHSSNNLNLFDEFMGQIAAISSANASGAGQSAGMASFTAVAQEASGNQPLKIKTKGIEATLLPLVNQVVVLV